MAPESTSGNPPMVSLAIELKTTCDTCDLPMPVNTLAPEVSCASCGRPTTVGTVVWTALFRMPLYDGPRMLASETRKSTAGKLQATYARMSPQCWGCQKEIPLESVQEVTGQAFLRCDRCGKSTWVRAVPTDLAAVLPGITHLLGEDPEPLSRGPAPAPELAVFPCPQCGSPLPFDGATRALTCRYCGAHAHVPDDFVYRGRSRIAKRWFLCFDPSVPDAAPLPRAVAAGLFDWEGLAQGVVDAEGNVYCACIQVHWFLTGGSRVDERRDFVLWSVDPALNVRWVRRDLRYEMGEDLRVNFSPPGELLITDRRCTSQLRLSCADGSTVAEIGGPKPATLEGLAVYEDLTCDRDGSVFMLREGRLLRLDPSGKEIPTWLKGASGEEGSRLLELHDYPVQFETSATQIHVAFDGSVYLCNYELIRYESDGRKSYCVDLSPFPDPTFSTLGGDGRGFAYLLGEDAVLRFSPSGACETVLKRERGGLPQYEMNLAVAPDGSFWLFGTEGLAWKFAPDSALLFASGNEQRPKKVTEEDLERQVQVASEQKIEAMMADAMAKAEATQKAMAGNIAQITAQEQKRETRIGVISCFITLIIALVIVAVIFALETSK
jgi:DNA-directed RNA polymerase subunit RPC12/RpoP